MAALLSEAGEHLRSSCSRSEAHDDIIVTVTYTLQKSSVHMRSANRYPNVVNHFAEMIMLSWRLFLCLLNMQTWPE